MFPSNNSIDIHLGMKYDLENSIKTSLLESIYEFKVHQAEVRNFLILSNRKRKQKEMENEKIIGGILKIKQKTNAYFDFSEEEHIPKGFYCYPLKGSYFQKSSLDIKYFPILPFEKFKEAIDAFPEQSSISECYQSYPCWPEEYFIRNKRKLLKSINEQSFEKILLDIRKKPVRPSHCTSNINKLFLIWCFIKIIKWYLIIMDKEFYEIYNFNKDEIIIPIVNEMNKHLKINDNILYYIIINFLDEVNKNLNYVSFFRKGITYKKYKKYYCIICNIFNCPFHFKIKIKPKQLDNNKIRTYVEYFKKIKVIFRPPGYLSQETKENEQNKEEVNYMFNEIIKNCPCRRLSNNDNNFEQESECLRKNSYIDEEFSKSEIIERSLSYNSISEENDIDDSLRFNKMAEIKNKEDFFILCRFLKTCYKILTEKFDGLYSKQKIFKFYLNPCLIRKIMHNKYDCNLLHYLTRIIIDDKYFENLNFVFESDFLEDVKFEPLPESNLNFFNNPNETNNKWDKNNGKNEKGKISNFLRTKATARLQIQSNKNLNYKPCNHYPNECTKENCTCAKNGFCLKYCCCYKYSLTKCNFMFFGCRHMKQNKTYCTDCKCRQSNIECVPGICNCGEKCCNNNITIGKTRKKLLFGYSEKVKGGGLFAGEKILKGDFIDNYDGEIVEKDELDRLSVFYDQTGNNYPFGVNNKFDFVTIKCGGLTRYINHGSYGEENVEADQIMVNGIPHIAFFATRDIKKYEELYYDYSYDENSKPQWNKEYDLIMERKIEEEEENKKYNKHHKKKAKNYLKNKEEKNNNDEYFMPLGNNSINLKEDEF